MARESNRRATVSAPVGFGVAELVPDPAHPRAWTLLVDGVPQSYVDLADPAGAPGGGAARRRSGPIRHGRAGVPR